jgi:hypothetical protein
MRISINYRNLAINFKNAVMISRRPGFLGGKYFQAAEDGRNHRTNPIAGSPSQWNATVLRTLSQSEITLRSRETGVWPLHSEEHH